MLSKHIMNNVNTDHILKKLSEIEHEKDSCKKWSLEEKKKLLQIYLIISKKEKYIFDLIYGCHGCDSWEDIFRDYDTTYLLNKADGVQVAIEELSEIEEIN